MGLTKILSIIIVIQVAIAHKIAKKGEFSFMISVQKSHRHVCSGVLIRENYALTAASCVSDNITQYSIKVGALMTYDDSYGVQIISIARIIIHPGYGPSNTSMHDIAILQWKPKSNRYTIINLPQPNESVNVMKKSRIINYRMCELKEFEVDRLKYFIAFAIRNKKCAAKLRKRNNLYAQKRINETATALHKSLFCATGKKKVLYYTIEGDFGYPLIQQYKKKPVLVGLASAVSPHNRRVKHFIFTQISLHVNWINKAINSDH
ncbi:serine protease 45-like [Copidosoma floridanum]|uniref:serine protease 45-like n=1 Tax=Copidosoma floridanum TaxID=29053 RepID=UPI0006C98243|nr:serine protease 45-like [Copidosoma floridanum]